jgi:glycosyltransferase involved in cell wall biosynthesis
MIGIDEASAELPVISVVTPSFNQAAFIRRTIQSVLDQAYPRLEYIILDGGSTDGSVDVIRQFASRLAYWTSEPDGGQSSAINAGWGRSTGDILAWLNSDDYYLPGTLHAIGEYVRTHPEVGMVYGTCRMVDPAGRPLGTMGRPFDMQQVIRGNLMIPQPSTFISKELWEKVGPIDETLNYSMDFDYFIRAARFRQPVFLDRALSVFTVHPLAKTTRDRSVARQEVFRVASRYATGRELMVVRLLALRARGYHLIPRRVRNRLDRLRGLPVLET